MTTVTSVERNINLIDLQTAGLKDFIASYVVKGARTAIVETGPSSSVAHLLEALHQLKILPKDVRYVAVSHVHLDHAGGAGSLVKHLPNAEVIVHARGAPHLANPEKLWNQSQAVLGKITQLYGRPEPVPEDRIISSADAQIFDLGNDVQLKVVETLGHASHHQSYIETSTQSLFPGDAAGIYLQKYDVIVPTTPEPFKMDIALASIEKLKSLNPRVLLYSHFGKATDATKRLDTYAEQLRLWATTAKEAISKNQKLDALTQMIIKRDPALQKTLSHIENQPVWAETVLGNSVQGIAAYVQRYGVPG